LAACFLTLDFSPPICEKRFRKDVLETSDKLSRGREDQNQAACFAPSFREALLDCSIRRVRFSAEKKRGNHHSGAAEEQRPRETCFQAEYGVLAERD
jgi:hypothetical protein